jgi:hypothetical protein
MFSVLQIVLSLHPVARRLGVTSILGVFLVDLSRRPADLDLRTITLQRPVAMVSTTAAATAAAAAATGLTSASPLTLHKTILFQ